MVKIPGNTTEEQRASRREKHWPYSVSLFIKMFISQVQILIRPQHQPSASDLGKGIFLKEVALDLAVPLRAREMFIHHGNFPKEEEFIYLKSTLMFIQHLSQELLLLIKNKERKRSWRTYCTSPHPEVIDKNSSSKNVLITLSNCPLLHEARVVWLDQLLDSLRGILSLLFLRGWVELTFFLHTSAKFSQKQLTDEQSRKSRLSPNQQELILFNGYKFVREDLEHGDIFLNCHKWLNI